ncbi:leukocyte elastase inhibitor-like [Centruroides vittatus]|uniref:leukocyte elastase inhibitor-like n=1 Tax=Centruroides vittatus TaxID=120091 RepID=UPI0035105257
MEKSTFRLITKLFSNFHGNYVCSPFLTSLIVSLLLESSREQTALEIIQAMNWSSIDTSNLRSYFNDILLHLNGGVEKVNVANQMFIENGLEISQNYKEILRNYGADVINVDFKKINETLSIINKWGIGKSRGLIKELIRSGVINSATIGVITSLMAFRGRWKMPFNKNLTQEGKFFLENGKETNVKMMFSSGHFKHGYFPEYKLFALELPYEVPDIVMVILIPSNLQDLKETLVKNEGELLLQLHFEMKNHNVEICLPKFQINTNILLEEKLQSMGIEALFNSETSNMKGISSKEDFYIQKIIQGVHIEVDEEATEGSAHSTSIIGSRSLLTTICADRPFIFYVQEKKYKSILFWGEYKTPLESLY